MEDGISKKISIFEDFKLQTGMQFMKAQLNIKK